LQERWADRVDGGAVVARTVGIGIQSFEKLIQNGYFYIDKTDFIKEWWESGDDVTLITRPRRFGKTLNMNMMERFFSVAYAGRGEIFEGLSIWKEEKYRKLQGTCPVIFLSFADMKASTFSLAREKICMAIQKLYSRFDFLMAGRTLKEEEKNFFRMVSLEMTDSTAAGALRELACYLSRYYGRDVIILLDEYDTPLQEAWVYGYWQEMSEFIRGLFNSTFKTNPYLERAIMTGITRVSKESIFSDLNNLEVVTATSEKYESCFGFTEEEVWEALQKYGLYDQRQKVKDWYDGFTFGKTEAIYNPWSVINFLDKKRLSMYWANTSSNSLVNRLIRRGSREIKMEMENLLKGGVLQTWIDEQIIFEQLDSRTDAVWSLLLAGGYLKVRRYLMDEEWGRDTYELALTNREVRFLFGQMIDGWFRDFVPEYNDFVKAMLTGDRKAMNGYMNKVAMATFSYFDSGIKPSKESEPERFYHGFVLGLTVDLADRYVITSNRESGYGRYDVVLEPKRQEDCAVIMEFKVRDPGEEKTLEETAKEALAQIERKKYEAALMAKGIAPGQIQKYGFAFEGKTVLIR
jgi:hypothetical protein